MYDLLIKGGTVIDPDLGIHGVNDVAVEDGKIARIAQSISIDEASRGGGSDRKAGNPRAD